MKPVQVLGFFFVCFIFVGNGWTLQKNKVRQRARTKFNPNYDYALSSQFIDFLFLTLKITELNKPLLFSLSFTSYG